MLSKEHYVQYVGARERTNHGLAEFCRKGLVILKDSGSDYRPNIPQPRLRSSKVNRNISYYTIRDRKIVAAYEIKRYFGLFSILYNGCETEFIEVKVEDIPLEELQPHILEEIAKNISEEIEGFKSSYFE